MASRSRIVGVGVAAALARRHADLARDLGEQGAALGVGDALLALDRGPFGMTGHRGPEYSRLSWPDPRSPRAPRTPPSPPAGRTSEADDDEERRPPPPSERRPGRPRRRRQDDARRATAVQGRGDPAARPGRRRDRPPRFRARGAEAPRVAEPRGRDVRVRRDADLAGRHARLSGLRRRGHRRLRRRRRRAVRDGRVGRRRGRPGAGGRARPRRRTPPPASSSTSATARTPTRRPPSTRCAPRSATRSRRSSSRSAPPRSFSGYVDLVHRKAYRWDGHDEVEIPIPDDLADEVARRRDQLLEAASEADDDVMTKYLEGEEISDQELEACLRKGVKDSVLAPVLVGWAAKGIGLRGAARRDRALPALARRRAAGQGRRTRPARRSRSPADENGPLLVRVFKTTADPFVGRLTYLRVLSGTLHSQAHVWNATRERGRADRPAAAAPRQGAGADRRAQGRRDRRGRQAGRDRDRRHAVAAREAARPAAARRSRSRR